MMGMTYVCTLCGTNASGPHLSSVNHKKKLAWLAYNPPTVTIAPDRRVPTPPRPPLQPPPGVAAITDAPTPPEHPPPGVAAVTDAPTPTAVASTITIFDLPQRVSSLEGIVHQTGVRPPPPCEAAATAAAVARDNHAYFVFLIAKLDEG